MIVAGLGFRPSCTADEIGALLREAERLSGRAPAVLAVPWFRADAPMLDKLLLGLDLEIVAEEALLAVQDRCPTRSDLALRAHGIASVAEGCALARAGTALILPRIASANATCALAEGRWP